jgi:DNA invertase Pin-like site-specific DNA recombinase
LSVTKPDRLARSTAELLTIEADLSKRGIALMILSMGGQVLDTRNPISKMILTILASVSCWEREIMLERQREGIAKAKAEGKYRGRQPTARAKSGEIIRMAGLGMTREQIAAELQIGVASVYRVLRAGRTVAVEANQKNGQ